MGISSSKENNRKSLETKLQNASKTGVLNMEDMELKPQSLIWNRLLNYAPDFPSKIKILTLSDNELKTLPAEVYELVNLRKIYVSRCSLQRIHNFTGFTRMTHAILDNNDLEENSVGQFPITLVHLDLSFNHLAIFPPTLSNLESLVELDLSSNRLRSTHGIGLLTRLQELKLDDNLLEEIDEDIGNLNLLKYLSLKRNKLVAMSKSRSGQSIPASLFVRTILDHLDLEGNTELSKSDLLKFEGISVYLERRQKNRLRNFSGGAFIDQSPFGLD